MSNHKNTNNHVHLLDITHNIYDLSSGFKHSLTIKGEEGLRVGYSQIARHGNFCAVTSIYSDYFPEVFMITNFSSGAKRVSSQSGSRIKVTTKIV